MKIARQVFWGILLAWLAIQGINGFSSTSSTSSVGGDSIKMQRLDREAKSALRNLHEINCKDGIESSCDALKSGN